VESLREIVRVHYQNEDETLPAEPLVNAAATRFPQLRREENLYKLPGTSEFLDWLRALHGFQKPLSPDTLSHAEVPLPYPEALFKMRADLQRHTVPRSPDSIPKSSLSRQSISSGGADSR
jgi:hypothetical protein